MKKSLKYLLYSIGIFLILFLCTFKYFEMNFENNLKSNDFSVFIVEIKESKNLPQNFYKNYERVNPDGIDNNFLKAIVNKSECQSQNVARKINPIVKKNQLSRFKYLTFEYFLIRKIEKNTSQLQCLNWTARKYNFLYGIKGIENASLFYFNKKIENLPQNEMEILIKMMENPVKNNPKRKKNFR